VYLFQRLQRQAAKGVPRGDHLGLEGFAQVGDGFKKGMAELGYREGKDIVYDFQRLDDDPEGEKRIAKQFVQDKVDLIFSFPTGPSMAAKAATQGRGIPVVFAVAGTEENDLVESVRRPGGMSPACVFLFMKTLQGGLRFCMSWCPGT